MAKKVDDLTALADNISSVTDEVTHQSKQTGGKKYHNKHNKHNKHNSYSKLSQSGGELTDDELQIQQYTSRQRSIATGILLAAGIAAGAWSFGLMQISALGRFASLQQLLVSLRIITEPCVDESAVGRHIFDQAMSYFQTSDTITCANISMEYENALKRLWTFLTGVVFVGYKTLNWKDSWKRMQLSVLRLLFTKPPTLEELQAQQRASDAIDAAAEAAQKEAIARDREAKLIELSKDLQHEYDTAKMKFEHAKRISQLQADVTLTDAQTSPLSSPTAATTTAADIDDATKAAQELKAAETAVKESNARIAAAQKAVEDAAEQAATDKAAAQHAAAEYTAIAAEDEDVLAQRDALQQFITTVPSSTDFIQPEKSKESEKSEEPEKFEEPEKSEEPEESKTVTTSTSARRSRRRRGGKKYTKKTISKKSHTKKSHTKKSHIKKSHTKKSHTKKSHAKKSHTKKLHAKKSI